MRKVQNKRTKKKSRTVVAFLAVLAVAALAVGAAIAGTIAEANSDKIIRNVYVDGVRIGGMTPKQAVNALEENFAEKRVTVVLPSGESREFSYEEMGISHKTDALVGEAYEMGKEGSFGENVVAICRSFFVPVRLSSEESVAMGTPCDELTDFLNEYNYEPTPSSFEWDDEKVVVQNGKNGAEIDEKKLISMAAAAEEEKIRVEAPINILPFTLPDADSIYTATASDPHPPYGRNNDGKITATVRSFNLDVAREIQKNNTHEGAVYEFPIDGESIAVLADENLYPDSLAECTTEFDTSYTARANNLAIAARLLDGVTLLPEEEFSFNKNNGEITKAKGYQTAKGYAAGKVVDTVGAGVCQVSSTLYNAALHSAMTIVKRSNHSLPVAYLPLGQDAAISYPNQDFVFKNSSASPVKICSEVNGGKLTVKIIGKKSTDFDEIKIENTTLSVINPGYIEKIDPDLAAGKRVSVQKGAKGYVVESRRIFLKDGVEIKSEYLGKSTYKAKDEIVNVGEEKE